MLPGRRREVPRTGDLPPAASSLSGRPARRVLPRGPYVGRCARAAESARLEIVCGETHRGFKSHRLRHMEIDETATRTEIRQGAPSVAVLDVDAAMSIALQEAEAAVEHGDVPVGAVALRSGRIVAARHNEREKRGDPTAHAELLALSDAASAIGSWRLSDVTLVVTLEPCPMCAGALVAARLGRLIFGAADLKTGACGSLYNLCADPRLNHEISIVHGVRADEASALLTTFFESRRLD
jgi:tRNA(adenine34) deaminase